MHYGMRPDGSRDRCVRTFHCLDDAESTLTEFLRLRALKRTRHGGEVITRRLAGGLAAGFYLPGTAKKTTVHGYENIIRLHLVPALGEVKLPELQPAQLQRYYAELLERDSPTTPCASTTCCCTRRWRPPSGRGCCGKT